MLADSLNAGLVPPWWLVLFPGCAITVTVLAFSLLGDGIRDLVDPRLRGAVSVRGGKAEIGLEFTAPRPRSSRGSRSARGHRTQFVHRDAQGAGGHYRQPLTFAWLVWRARRELNPRPLD